MKNFIPPYEQTFSPPPKLLELSKDFGINEIIKTFYPSECPEEQEICDDTLEQEDSLYLIRQRVQNLREAIGLTLDEIEELSDLENVLRVHDDSDSIPENLGMPGTIDQLMAALESKRIDKYEDEEYAGGDIEENEESVSSVNQYYQKLFEESWLNPNSILVLDQNKKPIAGRHKGKKISIFDLYQGSPPKYTFSQFLVQIWKIAENEAAERFGKESKVNQWKLKERWENHLEDRELTLPSPYQQVLFRLNDLATSPIYDEMQGNPNEHYTWPCGYGLRFTDKTAIFTFPLSECSDIPKKSRSGNEKAAFVQVSFLLPEYAHERKRFFRKGGTVEELIVYLKRLGVEFSEKQSQFLRDLVTNGALRLYHELLELPDRNEIRGYFLNVQKGLGAYSRQYIGQCIRDRLKQEKRIVIRQVKPYSTWFPEWMRKIGGIIIEEKNGNPVSVPKPLQIGVDTELPEYSVKHEPLFVPSERLLINQELPSDQWQDLYVAEMREAYKTNPKAFKRYAENLEGKRIELRCTCDNHGAPHKDRCPVPILTEIFKKIRDTQNPKQ